MPLGDEKRKETCNIVATTMTGKMAIRTKSRCHYKTNPAVQTTNKRAEFCMITEIRSSIADLTLLASRASFKNSNDSNFAIAFTTLPGVALSSFMHCFLHSNELGIDIILSFGNEFIMCSDLSNTSQL